MPSIQASLPLVLLSLSASLGIYLGYQYLKRRRNRPTLIAVHILPGLAALEIVAMMLRGAPDGTVAPSKTLAENAALLLVIALMIGLLTPMVARDRPRAVGTFALSAHALFAATAFVLLFAWVT